MRPTGRVLTELLTWYHTLAPSSVFCREQCSGRGASTVASSDQSTTTESDYLGSRSLKLSSRRTGEAYRCASAVRRGSTGYKHRAEVARCGRFLHARSGWYPRGRQRGRYFPRTARWRSVSWSPCAALTRRSRTLCVPGSPLERVRRFSYLCSSDELPWTRLPIDRGFAQWHQNYVV